MTRLHFGKDRRQGRSRINGGDPRQRGGNRLCRERPCRRAFPKYGGGRLRFSRRSCSLLGKVKHYSFPKLQKSQAMIPQGGKLHELPSPQAVRIPGARAHAIEPALLVGEQLLHLFPKAIVLQRRKRVHGLIADQCEEAEGVFGPRRTPSCCPCCSCSSRCPSPPEGFSGPGKERKTAATFDHLCKQCTTSGLAFRPWQFLIAGNIDPEPISEAS